MIAGHRGNLAAGPGVETSQLDAWLLRAFAARSRVLRAVASAADSARAVGLEMAAVGGLCLFAAIVLVAVTAGMAGLAALFLPPETLRALAAMVANQGSH